MSRKRRRFGSSFKAKVALESVREVRTISELAKKHKLHATQINLWKKQLARFEQKLNRFILRVKNHRFPDSHNSVPIPTESTQQFNQFG